MTKQTFTASNGLIFTFPEDGSVRWEQGHPPRLVTDALREYFTHERDEQLGRWRDPEAPDKVVYHLPSAKREATGRTVRVLDERLGATVICNEHLERSSDPTNAEPSAARYFAAHPEPRPWHSAQPGDVWLLTINDEQGPAIAFLDKNTGQTLFATPTFTDLEPGRHLISDGHRIWPTEGDDE